MKNYHKLEKLKVILILVFITSFFFVSLIYMFLKDVPVLLSLLEKYFTSGNSFFFPVFPHINLLWFLPEKYQIIRLTIGQVIDIIIVINIVIHIDSSFYHYVKSTCLKNDSGILTPLDLYIRNDAQLQRYFQEPDNSIELDDWSKDDYRQLNNKTGKKWILSKRINNLYNYYEKKKGCIGITRHKRFYLKFYNLSKFRQKLFNYYTFTIFSIFGLKNSCLPPNTNASTNFYEFITREDTEMKKKCIFSEDKIVLLFNSINN